MKKRGTQKTAAAIARGHLRELAKRGIRLDKRGRARKNGKPIKPKQLERVVSQIKSAPRPASKQPSKRPAKQQAKKPTRQPLKRPAKQQPKKSTRQQPRPTPKRLKKPTKAPHISERDAFILESLERNHLTPEVRKKYLRSLSPSVRKSLSAGTKKELAQEKTKPEKRGPKTRGLSERDAFILDSWESLSVEAQQKYFNQLSAKAKKRIPKEERERIEEEEQAGIERLAAEKERELLPVAQRMREDLVKAITPKTWEVIRKEVQFDTDRTQAIIIQKENEVEEASREIISGIPKQEESVRYYAVIAAVTQYPPEAHYGQRALNTDEPLTIFYFTAAIVDTIEELAFSIKAAINNMRSQLAGDTPIAIVGVYIRTKMIQK